ncbi:Fe-S-cluster redox enzyme [Lysinibacillus sp. 2017]|uniref:Fe-S-cluster redox enzyme n=1 Tax=unclassified Lysinibacillus TaxID=2636778 RepID=UPI000D5286E3|nr:MULTISPECIES: Fe-S-cluster redox enzyme [unclassified Lysinibacillus]AWE06030.1 Fe-S-cluster redox enzyme [Lysinibacillus sp. 2017]TGN34813.1 Fe-S-cluster redox enzyme [Lysinibacillus sp. S2017]
MLLFFDEQLFQRTNGHTGEKLEKALDEHFQHALQEQTIWGQALNSAEFLIEQDRAERFCFQLLKNYWGKVNLFFYDSFHEANFNIETANEKIQHFFDNPQNKQPLFQFLQVHGEVQFAQVVEFIFSKPISAPITPTGLDKISVYKVNDRFLIQPIYSEHTAFWETIYAKKMYSLFLQQSLQKMDRPVELMQIFKRQLKSEVSINRAATILHKLIQHIDYENPRSYALKQLHLLNVCTHFTSGRRHMLKLRKCIQTLQRSWSTGNFALNDKEHTLLGYMLFQEAIFKKDYEHIIEHGMYLIEGERLNDHAIELVVEYEDVLSSMNPQPSALVKNYRANYLEHVFYVLIDTLVKQEQLSKAFELMKDYELATCTVLFKLLNSHNLEEELHKIEATVQQDIAVLVDGSAQIIRESLATWQDNYLAKKGPYYAIAEMTSQHICNLLKILFHEEEDLLVEKLLYVYKKYLFIPSHLHHFRQFIEQRITIPV